ncbi:hypothetical protein GEU84_018035 [Fertoebacter nigrum]|uniref:Uncharacterized protein n=1 Tax=Fertoeibacter niger TaxID=2656921 RepID=A0A8X8KQS9_9RHOB|nr:hypothetical protein [Fertoeibacter niger]NUB46296.1 hypothetical protein [Fertoeibacter niger]
MRRALLIALLTVQVLAGCLPGHRDGGPGVAASGAPAAIEVTALDAPGQGAPMAVPDGTADADLPQNTAGQSGAGAAQVGPEGAQAAPAVAGDPSAGGNSAEGNTAATGETSAQDAALAEPPPPKSASELACERRGGQFAAAGTSGARACVLRTRDGGQQCRRQGDCQGQCLARSNTCAPVTPLFGCHEILQADGRRVTLCID